MSLRQFRVVFWLAAGLAGPSAQAGFVFFTINPANLNERALVGEQIFVVPGGVDYEFLVENIGTVGINGFFGGVGNRALAVAGGQWVGTAAGGADPANGFPASVVGGAFGPLITGEAGATNPFSPVPAFTWGFEEFDDRAVPAGLPTNYVVRWFNTGLLGPLPPGFFTRFDLFSPFGPTPGGGGVDPPTGDPFFGFEDVFNGNNDLWTLDTANLTIQSCNPATDANCNPSAIPGNLEGATAFGSVPEPASTPLVGFLILASIIVHKRASR